MMIALTSRPTASAAMEERFTGELLSIFLRGRKRIVRAHDQFTEELVRRVHGLAAEQEIALAGILLHEAEAELVVLEQVRAEFRHGHALGLRPLDQARQRGFVEDNFQTVLLLELIGEDPRTLDEGGFFLLVALGHEAFEDTLRFAHQFAGDAQLRQARAGEVSI